MYESLRISHSIWVMWMRRSFGGNSTCKKKLFFVVGEFDYAWFIQETEFNYKPAQKPISDEFMIIPQSMHDDESGSTYKHTDRPSSNREFAT